jgi:hypothetical protein
MYWLNESNRYKDHKVQRSEGEGLTNPTHKILDLFNEFGVRTTFFVQGSVALDYPILVKEISERGHEIACHDLNHKSPSLKSLEEFRDDIRTAKGIIEHVLRKDVLGYRAPNAAMTSDQYNVLSDFFDYDSSVVPCLPIPYHYGSPFKPLQPYKSSGLVEFPIATYPLVRLPAGTSWYLRNFGLSYVKWCLRSCLKKGYATFYFHPFEISDKLPDLSFLPKYVTRKIGSETFKMIQELLVWLRGRQVRFIPMCEALEEIV